MHELSCNDYRVHAKFEIDSTILTNSKLTKRANRYTIELTVADERTDPNYRKSFALKKIDM